MTRRDVVLSSDLGLGPLRRFWHPVAEASQVRGEPVAVTLLGEGLVLFRSGGAVRAFADLCVHRGTRLSLGWVTEDGCLQCPYHGWKYNSEGACVYIPSQPEDAQHVPSRARAVAYRAEECYGLVWVALDDPLRPIPGYPWFEDPEFHTWSKFCGTREAGAARFAENALDLAHLDFVHPGLLGSPGDTVIAPYDVEVDDGTVVMRYTKQSVGPETFADGMETVRHEVRLEMPYTFTIIFHGARGTTVIWGAHQPITSDRCALWRFESRNHSLDVPDQEFIDFLDLLLPQDQPIIESQRPQMVPVDLTEELHMKVADAGAIAYRRLLKEELGVEYV